MEDQKLSAASTRVGALKSHLLLAMAKVYSRYGGSTGTL